MRTRTRIVVLAVVLSLCAGAWAYPARHAWPWTLGPVAVE